MERELDNAVRLRKSIYDRGGSIQDDLNMLAESPPDAALYLKAMKLQAEIAQTYFWPSPNNGNTNICS